MGFRSSRLWRSSLIQISLLFLFFSAAMFWQYVFEPIIKNKALAEHKSHLEQINFDTISAYLSRTKKADLGQFTEQDQYAKQIFDANPALHYYKVFASGESFSSGRYPQWLARQNVKRLQRFSHDHSTPSECLRISKSDLFTDADGAGRYSLVVCGDDFEYEELSGLANSIAESSWRVLVHTFTNDEDSGANQRYIYIGAGVFLLAIGVMVYGYWSLRRLSKVVDSFEIEHTHHKLPTKDVPLEVVPLIEALNNLMSRLDEHESQRNFFLSTAAHEIRDPLTVLRMQAEELAESPEKDKVINTIRYLTGLTSQLLTLLKVTSWEVSESEDATDLVEACKKTIADLYDQADLNNVSLEFYSEQDNWYIVGNELLIELAVTNVLKNAISFTPEGGVVKVILSDLGDIMVIDQGKGVAPENAHRLFEPFCKYPPNRNGHGLGLAIVRSVVQLHQGKVWIENHDQGGAQVTLRMFPTQLAEAEG